MDDKTTIKQRFVERIKKQQVIGVVDNQAYYAVISKHTFLLHKTVREFVERKSKEGLITKVEGMEDGRWMVYVMRKVARDEFKKLLQGVDKTRSPSNHE